MLLVGTDIETTGLLGKDNKPGDHRIIELYAGLWDTSTRAKVDELNLRIHPQRSILPAAQAVHGITIADLEGCPIWDHVAVRARTFIERGDAIVWHNGEGFDRPFIDGELERIKLPPLLLPGIDTMLEGRFATAMGTVPNLGQLCWSLGIEYDADKAHAADYDVDVMMQAFFRGLDWSFFQLPYSEKAELREITEAA